VAIAFVQKTARFAATGAASCLSSAITTTADNTGILTLSNWDGVGGTPPTITDSKGNTGTIDQTTGDTFSGKTRASIGSIPLTLAGASHTWTINLAGTSYAEGNVSEFSGLTSTPLDVKGGQGYDGADPSVLASTAATTQDDELVIGSVVTNSADTNTNVSDPPATYTSIGVQANDNVTIGYQGSYKIVAVIGTQSVTWTFDAAPAAAGAGVIATYKASIAAPPATTPGRLGHFDPELRIAGWF
jgi:hypothetical protein